MTQPPDPAQPRPAPAPGGEDVGSTVLDLQRLLTERLRRPSRPATMTGDDELAIVSITSCNHHSC
jgi:hypothetical protein